jgi:hypothetical protein
MCTKHPQKEIRTEIEVYHVRLAEKCCPHQSLLLAPVPISLIIFLQTVDIRLFPSQ